MNQGENELRVLILSQYFWPESFRINEVAASLTQVGCDVTVLTGQPNYPEGRTFPGFRAWRGGLQPIEKSGFPGCVLYRVPIIPRGAAKAIGLAANYLSFVVTATTFGAWYLRRQKFDVIFVYGISPILQAIPGVLLKRNKSAALVTWVQDLWPQSLEVTGFVKSSRLLAMVSRLVRWIYRNSDLILVQSESFVSSVRVLAEKTPVKYHPNPGEAAFDAPSVQPVLALEPGFNVVFAGNLGTVQALETVVDAAQLLLPYEDVRIVLIGSGSRGEWMRSEAARRNLSNLRFPGRMPPEAMPGILRQASALLLTLSRSTILSQTIPSKVQAYLAAGRPIVASLDGEGARIVQEAEAGAICPAEDAAALAEAILRLRNMPAQELCRMGEAGRRYYCQHFDPTELAKQLKSHFTEATVRRSGQHKRVRAE